MLKLILIIFGVLISVIVIGIIIVLLLPETENFKYPFDKNGIMTLRHSIELKAAPEKIWDFLVNVDKNYKAWNSEDHVLFIWTKGKPWEKGSTLYSEQYMGGQLVKYKGWITESIPGKKTAFKFAFPISIMNPANEMIITDKGKYSVFTGVTYLKFNKVFRILFSRQIEEMVAGIEKHTEVENENMKRLLEGK
jgi:hypothetical protein